MQIILKLRTNKVGENGFLELRNKLDNFVHFNFENLWEGACRLGCAIDADYYAPRRVQIGNTRLHARIGLKYADGHKYSDGAPTEAELRQTVKDLESLIDAASRVIPAPFDIKIIEKNGKAG